MEGLRTLWDRIPSKDWRGELKLGQAMVYGAVLPSFAYVVGTHAVLPGINYFFGRNLVPGIEALVVFAVFVLAGFLVLYKDVFGLLASLLGATLGVQWLAPYFKVRDGGVIAYISLLALSLTWLVWRFVIVPVFTRQKQRKGD